MTIEPNKRYTAIVQGLSEQTDGKYKIHIPELMSHDKSFRWCYARNHVSPYGKWIDPNSNEVYSIGSYIPLQVGMNVEVAFETQSFHSGRIVGLVYTEAPLNKDDQENFYLFGKTKNGTQIYTDDSRNITHIMHNKGLSNIILMDDKISFSINEVSAVGNNNFSNIEMSKESIILKVGDTALVLDESGISFVSKDNQYNFGTKEMNFKTSKFSVEADSYEIQAGKIYLNGLEELHMKSTVSRLTGGQHLSLNGNVVNVDSNTNTTIQSSGSTNLKANINLSVSCPSTISLSTLGFLSLSGTSTVVDGINTVINGTSLALNGSVILEDSQIVRGMGVGSSMAASMVATAKSMELAMQGVDIGLTTAFHFNDPFSGMATNVMTETLPGVAQGAPNPMPNVPIIPTFDYVNSVIKYIKTNTKIGNIGTIDTMNSLRGNHFLKVNTDKSNKDT